MTRRQYIIIGGVALVVILAICLGLWFYLNKKANLNSALDVNQAVTLEKTSYQDRISIIQNIFAEKLGKTKENIAINIAIEDNNHIKGIVTVKDDYEGVFLANRINGDWKLVWEGKSQYPCGDIQSYNFPGEMVGDCLK